MVTIIFFWIQIRIYDICWNIQRVLIIFEWADILFWFNKISRGTQLRISLKSSIYSSFILIIFSVLLSSPYNFVLFWSFSWRFHSFTSMAVAFPQYLMWLLSFVFWVTNHRLRNVCRLPFRTPCNLVLHFHPLASCFDRQII